MSLGLADFVSGIFKPAAELVDAVHTSEEERSQLHNVLGQIQVSAMAKILGYEAQIAEARSRVIEAEAKGESWLQRSWRPAVMLTFATLIVGDFLGLSAPGLSEAVKLRLYDIIELGLGGYVIGRSAEKVVPRAISAWKAAK